ncbi:MAG: phosphoribosylanthranilate isomerase [Clostridium sp.]
MKIKICGITRRDEIEYVNELKPDYIGFLFAESKRQITADNAEELRKLLSPEIKSVGVFKDNSLEEIVQVLQTAHIDIIQLHGNESIDFIKDLKRRINSGIEIWKALSIKNKSLLEKYVSYYQDDEYKFILDNLLIDGSNPGSGETYSLSELKEILEDKKIVFKKDFKFILAGGITPENALSRISEVNPWGIDVSSGVEETDENNIRKKSYIKIKNLIDEVRKSEGRKKSER